MAPANTIWSLEPCKETSVDFEDSQQLLFSTSCLIFSPTSDIPWMPFQAHNLDPDSKDVYLKRLRRDSIWLGEGFP